MQPKWKQIIKQLNTEYTDSQLAEISSQHRTSIVRLRSGKIAEPMYSKGVALIKLHRETFPNLTKTRGETQ